MARYRTDFVLAHCNVEQRVARAAMCNPCCRLRFPGSKMLCGMFATVALRDPLLTHESQTGISVGFIDACVQRSGLLKAIAHDAAHKRHKWKMTFARCSRGQVSSSVDVGARALQNMNLLSSLSTEAVSCSQDFHRFGAVAYASATAHLRARCACLTHS